MIVKLLKKDLNETIRYFYLLINNFITIFNYRFKELLSVVGFGIIKNPIA